MMTGACTTNGGLTDNLGFCLPGKGDDNWLSALNANDTEIDTLVNSSCVVPPTRGGLLNTLPTLGDLLRGNNTSGYSLLAASSGLDTYILTTGSVPAYTSGILVGAGAPATTCNTLTLGALYLDDTNNRLYVCVPTYGGWNYKDLVD